MFPQTCQWDWGEHKDIHKRTHNHIYIYILYIEVCTPIYIFMGGLLTGFEGHLECPEFPVMRHVAETSEATGFEGHSECPEFPVMILAASICKYI